MRKLKVGDSLDVKVPNGIGFEVKTAKIRRIAPYQTASTFRMMTLDIDGKVAFAVCHENEVADA